VQKGKFNWVGDGQHGSTGKGLMNSYLAYKFMPEIVSTTSMPNAGHTAVLPDGTKFLAKALPSSAILNQYQHTLQGGELSQPYCPEVVLGAGAAFDIDQLLKEFYECKCPKLTIHERAGVITEKHRNQESMEGETGTKHIASTMQGCGAFLSSKIMRGSDVSLARSYSSLSHLTNYERLVDGLGPQICQFLDPSDRDYLPAILIAALKSGMTMLHEGSQGFGLDINHGSEYPRCTSRSCTIGQSVTDMGIPHQLIGDVYLVIRPYPIRVGNVVEDGVLKGHSGGCYPDNEEISWSDVAKKAGAPESVMAGELTSVTKRLRRVFTWSDIQFRRAVEVNGANKICLNFANYIDWSCYGKNQWADLSPKIHDWIAQFENKHQVQVALVGTGPGINHVCVRP